MFTIKRLEELAKGEKSLGLAIASYDESQALAKMALAAKNNGWIKCSNRMPEEGELIIFSMKNYGVTTGRYEESPSLFFDQDEDVYPPHIVTHWQPLPAAPEVE